MMRLKMGKRIPLCEFETNELANHSNLFFSQIVEVPRIKVGKNVELSTFVPRNFIWVCRIVILEI